MEHSRSSVLRRGRPRLLLRADFPVAFLALASELHLFVVPLVFRLTFSGVARLVRRVLLPTACKLSIVAPRPGFAASKVVPRPLATAAPLRATVTATAAAGVTGDVMASMLQQPATLMPMTMAVTTPPPTGDTPTGAF